MKYVKKPTAAIEAFCFDGDLKDKDGEWYVPNWAIEAYEKGVLFYKDAGELYVKTLEGELHVSVGNYVIRGVKGELYPCQRDIFQETYSRVEEAYEKVGKWEEFEFEYGGTSDVGYMCSECQTPHFEPRKYCPECGVKMEARNDGK